MKKSNSYRYNSITEKDSSQERLARLYQGEIQRKDEEALSSLLKTEYGRWFLMRLLDKSKVLSNCYTGNSNTFFNEGKRSVGLEILTEINNLGLNAVKLKQKAETEYIKHQQKALELAKEYFEGEDE